MDPKAISTTRALLDALDHRGQDAEARAAFDAAVWAARGQKAAILVTDLSGFTKQTKKHGILHFLHVFRRCEQACLPIIEAFGGQLMKQEADDLITIFDDPLSALKAGIEMQQVTQTLNQHLPNPDDHVRMSMGVDYGPLIRLDDDAFGDAVNVAFKLGEDVADAGELLIGKTAFELTSQEGFDWTPYQVQGPRVVTAGNVALEHWSLRLKG